jgi:hypothetical protein
VDTVENAGVEHEHPVDNACGLVVDDHAVLLESATLTGPPQAGPILENLLLKGCALRFADGRLA